MTRNAVAYLEVLGTGKYEAFDIFLPLFFPAIGERMDSSCEKPRRRPRSLSSSPPRISIERKELAKANKEPQRGEAEPLWRFESLDDRRQSAGDQWRRLLLRDIAELQGRGRPAPCRQLRRSRATHRSCIPFLGIPDAGIDPDVPVTPSIEDISRQGKDSELQVAGVLLKNPKS